ncbi:hypothetical protein K523DRAFT_204023, partial [Schizophyllum commune Tattone D]
SGPCFHPWTLLLEASLRYERVASRSIARSSHWITRYGLQTVRCSHRTAGCSLRITAAACLLVKSGA